MTEHRKNPHAVILGRAGGKAGRGRVKARPTAQARRAGHLGALARWGSRKDKTLSSNNA